MAKKNKYRFAKGFEDTRIVIPALRINLSKENFKDETVEQLLKSFGKRYAHNFELNEDPIDSKDQEKGPNAKERAKIAKEAESTEELDHLEENETASTVLKAIKKRREELAELEKANPGDAGADEGDEEEEE
ncbi:hypothetical protein [Croceimicrobium sp.]|uniref:hypothetical protein n=1 Tax=Croceimicrobium sp. TaxID=2828340 RepID=UPI003BAA7EDC